MLITKQSSNRRLIYSIKQMRGMQNQDVFNNKVEQSLVDESYDGGELYLLEADENDSYVLGYN